MPVHEIDLAILLQHLDDDTFLAEALLFPEVSRFGDDPEKLQRAVVKNAVHIVETWLRSSVGSSLPIRKLAPNGSCELKTPPSS